MNPNPKRTTCIALFLLIALTSGAKTQPAMSLDAILDDMVIESIFETSFDEPILMLREDDLIEDGKFLKSPPEGIDWVLEGPGAIEVKGGRMHMRNDPAGNCVLWNTRIFPENFVAEWDFQHLHSQGTAIIFFAAHPGSGGSIHTPGLARRNGNFGKYTRGELFSYHISYSATDEAGIPRGSMHLKKNICDREKGNIMAIKVEGPIDGKTARPFRLRLAKLGGRIVLEIDGRVYMDWEDEGERGGAALTSGQIGFRQMRHTIEGSYGYLKVYSVRSPANRHGGRATGSED